VYAAAAAVAEANAAATRALKQLAGKLAGSAMLLAAAVQLSDVMTALLYHSRAVRASGWSVPYVGLQEQQQYLQKRQGLGSGQQVSGTGQLQQQAAGDTVSVSSSSSSSRASSSSSGSRSSTGQVQQQAAGDAASLSSSSSSSSSRGKFVVKDLWPFWMVGGDSSTIKNDVQLDGFMLLTGPNMAGGHTLASLLVGTVYLSFCLSVCVPVCQSVCLWARVCV
jgi:hypothetical protein